MSEEPTKNLLPRLGGRREYFDYLDRWTVGTVDALRAQMTTRALVKAYLLETSRSNGRRDALSALASSPQQVEQVDPTLYRLRWPGDLEDWALVEIEDRRYPVIYTALESAVANRRVDHLVQSSSLLDRAWFAAPLFERLWDLVLAAHPEHRFSSIVFQHESLFEAFIEDLSMGPGEEEEDEGAAGDEDGFEVERRNARMQITERIGKLGKALSRMRPEYAPLQSIVSLRIPAPRRGGHDVYFNGRFTNRSDSVTSLRQTVATVTAVYRHSTEMAEEASWPRP